MRLEREGDVQHEIYLVGASDREVKSRMDEDNCRPQNSRKADQHHGLDASLGMRQECVTASSQQIPHLLPKTYTVLISSLIIHHDDLCDTLTLQMLKIFEN